MVSANFSLFLDRRHRPTRRLQCSLGATDKRPPDQRRTSPELQRHRGRQLLQVGVAQGGACARSSAPLHVLHDHVRHLRRHLYKCTELKRRT